MFLRVVVGTPVFPLLGIDVSAVVTIPDGYVSPRLKLYDDGEHGDGSANDGIYAATYSLTSVLGSCIVKYRVLGESNGIPFRHQDRGGFAISVADDTDGDGMPDRYEDKHHCLDKQRIDAGEDADLDGLTNSREFELGTDPCSADTDNGGESDGSELNAGRDPLVPTDDSMPALQYFHATNVLDDVEEDSCTSAKACILYGPDPAFDYMILERSLSPVGDREVREEKLEPTGKYIDYAVDLGQNYCYWLTGVYQSTRLTKLLSKPLGHRYTTPLEEPFCFGFVLINNAPHGRNRQEQLLACE